MSSRHPAMVKAKNAVPKHKKGPKSEIKRPEQVLKERKLRERNRRKHAKGKRGKKKSR